MVRKVFCTYKYRNLQGKCIHSFCCAIIYTLNVSSIDIIERFFSIKFFFLEMVFLSFALVIIRNTLRSLQKFSSQFYLLCYKIWEVIAYLVDVYVRRIIEYLRVNAPLSIPPPPFRENTYNWLQSNMWLNHARQQ